jgi:AraC-like DNA-binding protein
MAEVLLPETCRTVWVRLGQAAYLGPSLRLAPHSGSVDCVIVGVDAPFTLRVDGTEQRVRTAMVPARTRHQVITEGRVLFCYLDPAGRRAIPDDLLDHVDDPVGLLDRLAGPAEMDDRIRDALTIMRHKNTVSAAEVAREVHLSTSRFLHLFSAHAGTSFRRYRLWTRMTRMAAAISAGQDLTRASADAGFASPAHFSDSFRDMFGLSATTLLAAGTRVVVA